VGQLLRTALDLLNATLFIDSVHAAAMLPHRRARCLEWAITLLPEEQRGYIVEIVDGLLLPDGPAPAKTTSTSRSVPCAKRSET
jgi:hypothetical protein